MARFFIEKNQISKDTITILGEDAKHISSVLRCKVSEEIIACDKNGYDYICKISNITKKEVTLTINKKIENKNEPNLKITLFQGLPKGDKMELIIQKCVEIGIDCIIPVITDRTISKITPENSDKKILRFNKISESASKQSGRGKIPSVYNFMTFKDAILYAKNNLDKSLIPYELEKEIHIKTFAKNINCKNIGIFIGPEGGFTEKEIAFAKENHITSVSLGNRILRTETASLFTTVILLYESEE